MFFCWAEALGAVGNTGRPAEVDAVFFGSDVALAVELAPVHEEKDQDEACGVWGLASAPVRADSNFDSSSSSSSSSDSGIYHEVGINGFCLLLDDDLVAEDDAKPAAEPLVELEAGVEATGSTFGPAADSIKR